MNAAINPKASRASAPLPADIRLMQAATAVLCTGLAAMALTALGWWGVRHPAFGLVGITVQGDVAHNNAVTLRANVAPRLSGNFFTIDLADTRRVFESVPWVRHAVVRREFPNRLRVTLEEHQASAYWGEEGESRLLNTFGEIFEANAGDLDRDDLPRLTGPDPESLVVLQMYRALFPLVQGLDTGLDQLEMSVRGSWRAQLDNGALIELGAGKPVEVVQRLERFAQTLTQVASRYGRRAGPDLESADLRHKYGYALRLRGVTTTPPPEPKNR
jgi:cell division protein FtsQ